ncbi:MAG: GldG family protein [Oscillospiraceae bacterium]|nr:GldG family protein [Oscillospiraceae bacterium]
MREKAQAMFTSRAFRQGSVASAITVVAVALVLVLNLFVGALAQRHQWRLDLTADRAFVLTDQSREFLAELEVDVTIYILTPETTLTASGDYFFQANEVIRQYAALSPRITLEYIDLTRQPAFAARFPQFQLGAHTILLVSGERVEPISIFDLFNIETDQFGSWIASSRAEQVLTGALLFLSMEELTTVGVLTGFGKPEPSALVALLETNRYRVVSLNPLTQEIDPAVSMLVINAPTTDYPEHLIATLERFLQSERETSILYFASVGQPELPNLEAFLADWGIVVGQGVVHQTDLNMTWRSSPHMSAVNYTEAVFARHALGFNSIMPNARPLDVAFVERGARVLSAPLVFNESAVVMPLDADESWSPAAESERGPFNALTISQEWALLPGGSEQVSTLAVFASADFIDVNMLINPYTGNAQYMLGFVGTLTGQEIDLAIAPSVIGLSPLPVTDFQVMVYGILLVIVLPLAVVLAGTAVFLRRRYM